MAGLLNRFAFRTFILSLAGALIYVRVDVFHWFSSKQANNNHLLNSLSPASGIATDCSALLKSHKNTTTVPLVHFEESEALLLHPGKAGGGTFQARTQDVWNLKIEQCHPNPCLDQLSSDSYPNQEQEQQQQHPRSIVVLIRDPIDRFVSAFYWLTFVYCNPDGDTRTVGTGQAVKHPTEYCKVPKRKDVEMVDAMDRLFHQYNRNVNRIAKALCRTNEKATKANKTISEMKHAQHSIVDWLGPDWKSNAPVLFPVVVEQGFDFDAQVDEAVHWIHDRTDFEKSQEFAVREAEVRHKDCLQDNAATLQEQQSRQHSSSMNPDFIALSEAGEKCLAQYYTQDYEVIRELEQACKTRECRGALQSILDRRAHLLE